MFCFSCKYISESPIKECIESILKFYPNEKILIADSKSDDKTYLLEFEKYSNIDFFIENENRSIGSLWESYKRYPNESFYVLLQDTIILKKSLDEYINSNNLFTSFIYFIEVVGQGCLSQGEYLDFSFYKKIFKNTEYSCPNLNQTIFGSFGPIFIIKNEMMKSFHSKGLIDSLSSGNSFEQQCIERVIGICAEQEGFSPRDYNIEGEYYNCYNNIVSKNLQTFDKIFLMSNNMRN